MRKIYLYILLLLLVSKAEGQQYIEKWLPESGTKEHIARDYIKFKDGYSYKATGTATMRAAIDEHIVIQTEYQADPPSEDRQLNTSYAVGTTAGAADVSPTGAAVYQIPIAVPPGTGGVQPNLSIAYNSQSGNGLLGLGWNFSGISMISRCGKNFYYDSRKVESVKMNDTDNLMLDGQRLLRASGNNLANNSQYQAEMNPYDMVTCKRTNSRIYFEIKTKDGWTFVYGSTDDSHIDNTFWLLCRVSDPNGNYMTYRYDKDNRKFRLREINYTGNTGLSPYHKVEFFYETRTDVQTTYVAGNSFEQDVLLKRIKVSSGNTTFREYKLDYSFDNFFSKLTEVEEYGQDGSRYNSTVIDWGIDAFAGSDRKITVASRGGKNTNIYADFNGDGRTDFISYVVKSSYTASDKATLYLATDNNGVSGFTKSHTIPLIAGFEGFTVGDFDGNGLPDLFRIYKSGSTYRYNYYRLTQTGFSNQSTYDQSSTGKECMMGDFDGNGKMELLLKNSGSVKGYSTLSNASTTGIDWGTKLLETFPNNCYLTDFNGNGKTDIMTLNATGCKVYELVLNGGSFTEITTFATTNVRHNDGIFTGDFNGDGLTDLLVQRNNSECYILFSTGTSFIKKTYSGLRPDAVTFTGDVNHDGKTDVIQLAYSGSGSSGRIMVSVGTFTGKGFTIETYPFSSISNSYFTIFSDPYGNAYRPEMISNFNVSDFNGDGRADLIFNEFLDDHVDFKSFNDPACFLVKSITDGLNRRTTFSCKPMPEMAEHNPDASSFATTRLFPLYMVNSMTVKTGGLTSEITYRYGYPWIHLGGKGFLGISKVEASDLRSEIKTVNEYNYSPSYFYTFPKKQTVTDLEETTTISTVDYYNNYILYASEPTRIFPYISKKTETDHLTGLTATTEYYYAKTDHGNPTTITQTRGSWKTVTTNTWEAKVNGVDFKNRLTNLEVKHSGIQGTYIQTTGMDYDGKGRLTSQVDFKGTSNAVTTIYSNFDSFGNPRTATTTASGCPAITVTAVFDATGRFATSSTDVVGTVETQYDVFGRVAQTKDAGGLVSTCQYDGFGNLVRETPPVGSTVSYTQAWDIDGYQLYRTDRTEAGAPSQSVWYNATGQEIKARTKGFSGDIYTKTEYNGKGQLYRSYLPAYGNPSARYTEYEYDTYGRIKKEISVAGTTNYTYSGRTVTVTRPDNTFRTETLNASGLTETVTDGGGTVSYTYNSLGKPVTVTAGGLTTTLRYDHRGYQIRLKDPNTTDTIQYTYDAYGKLRNQKNARRQTTTFVYDAAGRMVSETCPEMSLTYHYIASGKAKGQLEFIKTANTELRKITYNDQGFPAQITEKIDGTDYITKYTYDSYGRLQQEESPSGFKLVHVYSADGYLTALRNGDNNANLWSAGAVNAFGQVTSSTLGNGLTRTTAYDSNFLLDRITLYNGSTKVDDVDYSFTASSGNLGQRNDLTLARNEVFGYDALNRLNSVKLNTAAAKSVTYKADGSINTKFDVGTYKYTNNNHAVSGIENLATGYAPQAFELEHTSFNRTSKVEEAGQKITFDYGPDKQLNISRQYAGTTLQTTRYYNGTYEKEVTGGTTKEYDYIYSPEGLAAIAVKTGGTRSLFYTHTDHLGSLRTVTGADKTIKAQYSYDAWGVRTPESTNTMSFTRGFTGHEHLDDFDLINMNARMYDPALGRFLSVDPYVQMPDYTQSFNRYSYALNNPLVYTDPSGELIGEILFIAAMTYFGGLQSNFSYVAENGGNPFNPAHWNWKNPMTYISMASAALGAYNQIGGLNGFSQSTLPPYNHFAYTDPPKIPEWATYSPIDLSNLDYSIFPDSYILSSSTAVFKQWNPTLLQQWSMSSHWAAQLSYNIVNGIYVTAQSFFRGPNSTHLSGAQVVGNDRLNAFVSTSALAVPSSATSVAAKGVTQVAAKGVPSRFGQIRGGLQKAQELTKSNHNLKLLDGKRIDLKGRHPLSKGHYNKVTKEQLGYPHVYDPTHPGGVRAPNANDYIEIFNLFK